jgi:hypothetical protein
MLMMYWRMRLFCKSWGGAHDKLTERDVKPMIKGLPGGGGTSANTHKHNAHDTSFFFAAFKVHTHNIYIYICI